MRGNGYLNKALASLLIGAALLATLVMPGVAKASGTTGWQGEYFANPYMWGVPVLVRTDSSINFNWGIGSPDPVIPADGFSVRWTRVVYFDGGRYRFNTETDDGVRLYVDGVRIIDQWRDQPATVHSAERDLAAGSHTIQMEYYENAGGAMARLWWDKVTVATPTPEPSITEWRGEYYSNPWLAGWPTLVRNDRQIQFDWGLGSPDYRIPADGFSVRWTRTIYLEAGRYRFTTQTDDGVRLFVDGVPTIQQWRDQPPTSYSAERDLSAGYHTIQMEYYENTGGASAFLWWRKITPEPPITEWRGEYFANRWLYGPPVLVRNDRNIRFDWGSGSPDSRVPSDEFSVRWTRTMYFRAGQYEFKTKTDDGVRLFVDDRLLIDQWRDMAGAVFTAKVMLAEGNHVIRMEYYENKGNALAELSWTGPLPVPSVGNLITCVRPQNSWIKVYQRTAEGGWLDINPNGWGPIDPSGYLKIDGLPVDYYRYGAQGHPYRIELWANWRLIRSVGNIDAGQPEFRIRPDTDNYTPWGCPAP